MKARKPIAIALAGLLSVAALFSATTAPAFATPPAGDNAVIGAGFGAQWLIAQADPSGAIGGSTLTSPVYNGTAQAVLSLAVAGQGEATFDAAVTWLTDNAGAMATSASSDDPGFVGLLGTLLLVADVASIDPTNFGGVDLIDTLGATLQPSGLYGDTDATYDGVYRQSLALLGLDASGVTPPVSATDWLIDQQCTGTPTSAQGGWQAYRADTAVACTAPGPSNFSGPDTNSTALAIQASAALGLVLGANALTYLHSVQDPVSGGFAYTSGPDVDANSTALVIQAIASKGQNPRGAGWTVAPDKNPMTSLLSWQLGCEAGTTSVGAFQTSSAPGVPNMSATIQGVWGEAKAVFPLAAPTFGPRTTFVDVCVDNNVFFDEITRMAGIELTQGFPDGTFRPRAEASRQALAAYMYRAIGPGDYVPPVTPTFSDVPTTHLFYTEIEWAASQGIVVGYPDGSFGPTIPASRQVTAAFFYRAEGSPPYVPPVWPTFSDVPLDYVYFKEIEWAASEGLLMGSDDGTFDPTGLATRQTTMAFFDRYLFDK